MTTDTGCDRAILLIDDSSSVREVLRVALEAEGYRVIEATDGREGVRLLRERACCIPRLEQI